MVKKLLLAIMLMPMVALATTWHANGASGSDYNSSTSQSSAKATIQSVINALSAHHALISSPSASSSILYLGR